MGYYLPKTKISRKDYNLLLNWRRVTKFPRHPESYKPFVGAAINFLPVEINYMKRADYYYILNEWINGADVFEVTDDPQSVASSSNQTTLGDVISELQEQFNQAGNIDVKVYESDDHMVITYE